VETSWLARVEHLKSHQLIEQLSQFEFGPASIILFSISFLAAKDKK
jgi:hypothetical protein